jgi:hypothetical protein
MMIIPSFGEVRAVW